MVEKMDLSKLLRESTNIFLRNKMDMLIASGLHFFLMLVFLYMKADITHPLSLPWFVLYYIFWSCFFRYCFNRVPFFRADRIFRSFLPSGKILLLASSILFVLLCLPVVPLYISMPFNLSEKSAVFLDNYSLFLQSYMEDSRTLDLIMTTIFIFISPIVVFRPLFAWIGVLLGRNGSIRHSFRRTKGNYWCFVSLGIVMGILIYASEKATYNLVIYIFEQDIAKYLSMGFFFLVSSPLLVYYNIVFAKMYELFFSEKVKI